MELRQLRQFLAVAQEGSFTAAARRLHMAQSPLSRSVQRLERELGVQLIDRHRRQIRLTAAGQALCEQAQTVLDTVDGLGGRIRRAASPVERVALAVLSDLPPRWLQRAGARLRDVRPDIRLELLEGTSSGNPGAVLRGVADLALTRDPVRSPGADVTLLVQEQFGVVVAADHVLAGHDGPLETDQLGVLGRWLGFPRSDAPGWFDQIATVCRAAGLAVDGSASSDARDIKYDRIALGDGMSFAPAWQAAALRRQSLAWLPLARAPLVRCTYLVHRTTDHGELPEQVDVVVSALVAALRPALRPAAPPRRP